MYICNLFLDISGSAMLTMGNIVEYMNGSSIHLVMITIKCSPELPIGILFEHERTDANVNASLRMESYSSMSYNKR